MQNGGNRMIPMIQKTKNKNNEKDVIASAVALTGVSMEKKNITSRKKKK